MKEKTEKRIVIFCCIFSAAIIFYAIGFSTGASVVRKKTLEILDERMQYIALKFDIPDVDMEAVEKAIVIMEKINVDIAEIIWIRDNEIKSRIKFGEVEK